MGKSDGSGGSYFLYEVEAEEGDLLFVWQIEGIEDEIRIFNVVNVIVGVNVGVGVKVDNGVLLATTDISGV